MTSDDSETAIQGFVTESTKGAAVAVCTGKAEVCITESDGFTIIMACMYRLKMQRTFVL